MRRTIVLQSSGRLSDNGPCYVSGELRLYLAEHGMRHTRGAPDDMYAGRQQIILCRRERIKRETLERRKRQNLLI